ncbi:hypothetical protein [Tsukamurella tyrosinosolvens]|uniref:hypothetical protein n=1 Tax=Tsukamurella tyrosinosolvens TaxID=57704 RepID=UPI00125EA23B|nr:hypothetical protein [Tsukamurella tyrosinosolvens]
MSRRADIETRTVPVAVLRAGAGVLLVLWLTLLAAFMATAWSYDGPRSQQVARGAILAAILVLGAWMGQSWRTAIGMAPALSASGARYFLASAVLLIPAMTLIWLDFGPWQAWRVTAVGVLAVGILILFVLNLRDRRRHKGEIVAPVVAMTVHTARGDREVRIAQPECLPDRWITHWSIDGAPQGTIHRVSYGPDPMRSLTAALADAEAAVAVI